MNQPLVVIVSGAPGSGKAALAAKLAVYMKLPLIERDTILKGLEYTHGPIDKVKVGIPTYYAQLKSMIDAGISLVMNETLYKNISEKNLKTNVLPYASVVNIHAHSPSNALSDMKTEQLKKIYGLTNKPLDLNVPIIEVVVKDEYEPEIGEVAARIRETYTGEPRDLWDDAVHEEIS
jgi:hypothetical protein